ncbi:MAG TPA: ATP-dependent DNA helicase [Nakamurella sp.]|nr:ATP-dependent DNA helicase [Nakamurella sp.]
MISATELAAVLGLPAPTPEQLAVIEAPLAPSLVVAGAGSGKTETMAARVVYLVATGQVRAEEVLGLTFTRKAAAQLSQRIRKRLRMVGALGVPALVGQAGEPGFRDPDSARGGTSSGSSSPDGDPEVSTYHAFGGRLIADFGPLAGVEPSSTVLTPTAAWQLARRVVTRWDGDLLTDLGPDQVTERLLAISGALADHLTGPDELAEVLDELLARLRSADPVPRQRGELHSALAKHVKSLQDRQWIVPLVQAFSVAKRERGAIDFADQMQVAAQLVLEHPKIGSAMRERYRVVLLDEYQDTGHAQRVILRALFSAGHPVTAVGDPVQSIYSWRGASASNLPRFTTDFPQASGRPSVTLPLLTSFRNPESVLAVANHASAPIRTGAVVGPAARVTVGELRPRHGAPQGEIAYGLFGTVADEDAWVAASIARRWRAAMDGSGAADSAQSDSAQSDSAQSDSAQSDGPPAESPTAEPPTSERPTPEPPTTAVLVRRRRDMAGMAAALREQGLPVEVVGLGGLLDEPEIADLVATLRVLVDPTAGPAMIRLLTGARWQLGTADLEALAQRSRTLAIAGRDAAHARGSAGPERRSGTEAVRNALTDALSAEDIDTASLVDAIGDPGTATDYSRQGHRRLTRLAAELDRLRARMGQPLPDLIADIEHTLGLDVEIQLGSPAGRAHLDAFAAVVSDVASTGAGPGELLDYLDAAAEREDGLTPGEVPASSGRVQVLTIHAAKGLEWEIVAVPHLTDGVFPNSRGGTWLGDAAQLPPVLRGDRADLPSLALPPGGNQKDLADALAAHTEDFREHRLTEERRLLYVALTRAERVLLASGHHWGATTASPAGPSEFLHEIRDASGAFCPPEEWAEAPDPTVGNPLTATPRLARWPVDPLGERRSAVRAGADRVLLALTAMSAETEQPTAEFDPFGWTQDVTTLLAERSAAHAGQIEVDLPGTVSVSSLVDLARDPGSLARRLRRPVPSEPAVHARRGTAFHRWLEGYFSGEALVAVGDLPGAGDRSAAPDPELDDLRARFLASPWAFRVPQQIEMPFATRIGGIGVRGRIDAVFADADGGLTVVDWKTGRPPAAAHRAAASVQLACYRLAVSELRGVPLDRVRAAFYYVATGDTVAPADVLDAEGICDLIADATSRAAPGTPGDAVAQPGRRAGR